MKVMPSSQQTRMWLLQHSTEWIHNYLNWDTNHKHCISKLVVNLIIHCGDKERMLQDVIFAMLQYYGFIIP